MQNTPQAKHASDTVIVAAKRSAIGRFKGCFTDMPAPMIGAKVLQAMMDDLKQPTVNEAWIGCVLPAGLGQAPARQVALKAGLPDTTACTTINKVCGSSMYSMLLAHQSLQLNPKQLTVAGGIENMSRSPYLLPMMRLGQSYGPSLCQDHMQVDGLLDAYDQKSMAEHAEAMATTLNIDRDQCDTAAEQSLRRAKQALETKAFSNEIIPIENHGQTYAIDQWPSHYQVDKIREQRPLFDHGIITPANASALADGAAILLLTTRGHAEQHHWPILASIAGFHQVAARPSDFSVLPKDAIIGLSEKLHWPINQVDLFEINEAFAWIPPTIGKKLAIDQERINIHGGACALGHPLGASGARIVVSLIHALHKHQLQKGIATVCIGGGEALAVAIAAE